MHAKNFLVNQGGDGKTIETVCESLPELYIIAALALIVETVYTIDRGALMVSSQEEKVFWVLNLVGQKKAYSFK
jgi:hypothetical protein